MKKLTRRLLLNPDAQTAMMRLVADAVPALIAYFEQGTTECLFANRRYAEYNGLTPETILGKTVLEVLGEATYQKVRLRVEAVLKGQGSIYVREQPMPDGSLGFVEVSLVPHFDNDQVQRGVFVLLNDVTAHLTAANALRLSEERMRKFAEATNEGIVFHQDQVILDVNDAMLRMSGYQRPELIGHKTTEFVPVAWHEKMQQQYLSQGEAPYELAMLHRDGHEVPLECVTRMLQFPEGTQRLVVVRDMTAHRETQRQIRFLALHDTLTQLPNRAYLRERLESIVALARRHQGAMAVLFIDLDHFKSVNDSLGHHVGDELLREVARRLQAQVRDSDVVSRLGGDEFVVVLAEIASSQDAAVVAQKLLDAVNAPIKVGVHALHVSPSIGVSLYPGDGATAEELMQHADSAMYHAKESGRSNYKFFQPDRFERASGALDLERQLRDAIFRREFLLEYQPQQRRSDGAIAGLEALVRWQHPDRGRLGPDQFIGFAESRGLVGGIDRWVLQAACRQMKAWHDMGSARVPVAINLSAVDFRQGDLYDEVAGVLIETGLAPRFLEIEITESVFMDRDNQVLDTLTRLNALGVGLTLDDFGTGYSSLAYLKRYPIGKLKIDRSFINDLTTDEGDLTLVTAIIQMAHGLKLKTVAEGVETEAQMAMLQQLGCDEFQGYLVARPLPARDAQDFICKPASGRR